MTYLDQLKADRSFHQEIAERHAEAMLDASPGEREMIMDTLKFHSHAKDMLDQQISWMNRRTGWTWPKAPAWTH